MSTMTPKPSDPVGDLVKGAAAVEKAIDRIKVKAMGEIRVMMVGEAERSLAAASRRLQNVLVLASGNFERLLFEQADKLEEIADTMELMLDARIARPGAGPGEDAGTVMLQAAHAIDTAMRIRIAAGQLVLEENAK